MKKYYSPKSDIHFLARGLLLTPSGDVVLCRPVGKKWFFLPGGHIENGESARDALGREIVEEMGEVGHKITSFVGLCENIFDYDEAKLQHEVNVIFEVDLERESVSSKLEHIEFVTVKKEDLRNIEIMPPEIKDGIIEWLENKKPFFKELNNNFGESNGAS